MLRSRSLSALLFVALHACSTSESDNPDQPSGTGGTTVGAGAGNQGAASEGGGASSGQSNGGSSQGAADPGGVRHVDEAGPGRGAMPRKEAVPRSEVVRSLAAMLLTGEARPKGATPKADRWPKAVGLQPRASRDN